MVPIFRQLRPLNHSVLAQRFQMVLFNIKRVNKIFVFLSESMLHVLCYKGSFFSVNV